MDGSNFDDLAKKLSATTSRRDALRLLGGTFAAGALAALLPGRALAKGGGNSACAHFCAAVFGADTPAAEQCTSDAAHHKGLCYQCGPAAPANGQTLCGQTCCAAGATCANGQCQCPTEFTLCVGTTTSTCCPSVGTCNSDGTCGCLPTGTYCSEYFGTCNYCCSRSVGCSGITNTCQCF